MNIDIRKKREKRRLFFLSILTLISLSGLILTERSKIVVKKDFFAQKRSAVKHTIKCFEALKEFRFRKAVITDDLNDPYQSSLIGQEFSLITTKYGDLEAKLLSTNPNFAALIIEYFGKIGLKRGDRIGIGVTGSFPALNIAALSAAETLGLKIVIISSVGSSSWGANDPYFTWLDMESVLKKSKLIKSSSVFASIGGGEDTGMGLSPAGRELIVNAIKRNNVSRVMGKGLEEFINSRMKILFPENSGSPLKAYINIGGGMASIGNSSDASEYPSGLILRLPGRNFSVHGIVYRTLLKKIPVINLHNIRILAKKSGIHDKFTLANIGFEGPLFTETRYDIILVIIITILIFIMIGIFTLIERREIYDAIKVKK